jgi:murein DD-endopeptidase MepM/ murein hydrolase activator NlpD
MAHCARAACGRWRPGALTRCVELTFENAWYCSIFGWRSDPFSGQSRFHGGVDIQAVQGDPVPAAKAGQVVFCKLSKGLRHDRGARA